MMEKIKDDDFVELLSEIHKILSEKGKKMTDDSKQYAKLLAVVSRILAESYRRALRIEYGDEAVNELDDIVVRAKRMVDMINDKNDNPTYIG